MYLKQSKGYNGKTFLSFVQGYRDEFGKVKSKTIKKIGYLEDLKKQYDDPISYFKQKAKEKNNDEITNLTINNLNTKTIDKNSHKKKFRLLCFKTNLR